MLVLSVASTINMVIYERTGEFGTLLALGCGGAKSSSLCCSKMRLLVCLAACLECCRSGACRVDIRNWYSHATTSRLERRLHRINQLVPWVLVGAAMTGVLAAILAAVLPAAVLMPASSGGATP